MPLSGPVSLKPAPAVASAASPVPAAQYGGKRFQIKTSAGLVYIYLNFYIVRGR